jgi:catechol 2,3-dioxygenase-like lactoylglutathione lyase family enzyme
MNFLRIKETCIYSKDLERAKEFYHELLGLPLINYLPGKHLFVRVGDSVLLLFNPNDSKMKVSPPAHFAEGKQHFAFEVAKSDYDDLKASFITKGIRLIDEVTWKNGSRSFYFNDPDGNVLEIVPEGIWD